MELRQGGCAGGRGTQRTGVEVAEQWPLVAQIWSSSSSTTSQGSTRQRSRWVWAPYERAGGAPEVRGCLLRESMLPCVGAFDGPFLATPEALDSLVSESGPARATVPPRLTLGRPTEWWGHRTGESSGDARAVPRRPSTEPAQRPGALSTRGGSRDSLKRSVLSRGSDPGSLALPSRWPLEPLASRSGLCVVPASHLCSCPTPGLTLPRTWS